MRGLQSPPIAKAGGGDQISAEHAKRARDRSISGQRGGSVGVVRSSCPLILNLFGIFGNFRRSAICSFQIFSTQLPTSQTSKNGLLLYLCIPHNVISCSKGLNADTVGVRSARRGAGAVVQDTIHPCLHVFKYPRERAEPNWACLNAKYTATHALYSYTGK